MIAGVLRNVTSVSPPTSTPDEPTGLMTGNGATLKPEIAFALVEERITPATKSPSKIVAAFGGVVNAFVTEVLKPVCSAPDVPPAMLPLFPTTSAIAARAAFTDGSVHLIVCAVSAWYFACPNVRR